MTNPKDGKVAEIEDQYVLIVNRGSRAGVQVGDIYSIKDLKGVDVVDPDTKEVIGERHPEKLRVRVIEVSPAFCRATTYRTAGGLDMDALFGGLSTVARRERIKNSGSRANTPAVVVVNVGDLAVALPPDVD